MGEGAQRQEDRPVIYRERHMETPRDTERKTEERDASREKQTFRERKDGGVVTGGDRGEMDGRIEEEREAHDPGRGK